MVVSNNQQAPGSFNFWFQPVTYFFPACWYSSHHVRNSKQEARAGDRAVLQDALYSGICLYSRASPAPWRIRKRDHLVEHSFAPNAVGTPFKGDRCKASSKPSQLWQREKGCALQKWKGLSRVTISSTHKYSIPVLSLLLFAGEDAKWNVDETILSLQAHPSHLLMGTLARG